MGYQIIPLLLCNLYFNLMSIATVLVKKGIATMYFCKYVSIEK